MNLSMVWPLVRDHAFLPLQLDILIVLVGRTGRAGIGIAISGLAAAIAGKDRLDLFGLSLSLGHRSFLSLGLSRLHQIFRIDPASVYAGFHDQLLGIGTREFKAVEYTLVAYGLGILFALALDPADEIVGCAVGKVLDGLYTVFAKGYQHRRGDTGHLCEFILDAQLAATGITLAFNSLKVVTGAGLNLVRRVLVEAFDVGNLGKVHIGNLLDRGKAFGHKQLSDDLVNVELIHEHVGALDELL